MPSDLRRESGTELSTENQECFQERTFNTKLRAAELRAAELRQSSFPVNKMFYHSPPEYLGEFFGAFDQYNTLCVVW